MAQVDRGIELYEAREYDAAIEILERAAEQDPTRDKAAYFAGRAYFDKEQFRDASRWFEKAIKTDPQNADYHSWLGRAYGSWALNASMFRKMSLAGDIKREFQKAVELDPRDLEMRNDLITFYLEAPGVAGGSTERALEQARAIESLDPVQGQFALGRVYEKQKDYDEARAAYRKAIDLAPEETASYYRLAYLMQRLEEFDDAFEVFEALVEKHPDDLGGYYQLGRNGALSGTHPDRSAEALEHYIAEHAPDDEGPSLAWAYTRLGQVLVHRGDTDSAREALDSALQLEPDHKQARKALKSLR
jgi:tetratricopeptide (TPR) repeat protein